MNRDFFRRHRFQFLFSMLFLTLCKNMVAQINTSSLDSVFVAKAIAVLKDSISKSAFDSLDFSNRFIYYEQNGVPMGIKFRFKNNYEPDSSIILGFKNDIIVGNWLKENFINENSGYIYTSSFDQKNKSAAWFKDGRNIKAIRSENGNIKILFDYTSVH